MVKHCLLAVVAIQSSLAFAPPRSCNKLVEQNRHFMSNNQEEQGDWIKTVNSKEIFFDEKKGRFFETKKTFDDNNLSGDDVSGPFSNNPFAKPEGTFFEELFSKTEEPEPAMTPPPVMESPATPGAGIPNLQHPQVLDASAGQVLETPTSAGAGSSSASM